MGVDTGIQRRFFCVAFLFLARCHAGTEELRSAAPDTSQPFAMEILKCDLEQQGFVLAPLQAVSDLELVRADMGGVLVRVSFRSTGHSPERCDANCEIRLDDGTLIVEWHHPALRRQEMDGSSCHSLYLENDAQMPLPIDALASFRCEFSGEEQYAEVSVHPVRLIDRLP